jgi:Rrf2 family protein
MVVHRPGQTLAAEYTSLPSAHSRPCDNDIVTAKEISDKYGIPYDLLAKVLQRLSKANLIVSHQGVRGGYSLALDPRTVHIPTIIHAIEAQRRLLPGVLRTGWRVVMCSTPAIKFRLQSAGKHRAGIGTMTLWRLLSICTERLFDNYATTRSIRVCLMR